MPDRAEKAAKNGREKIKPPAPDTENVLKRRKNVNINPCEILLNQLGELLVCQQIMQNSPFALLALWKICSQIRQISPFALLALWKIGPQIKQIKQNSSYALLALWKIGSQIKQIKPCELLFVRICKDWNYLLHLQRDFEQCGVRQC